MVMKDVIVPYGVQEKYYIGAKCIVKPAGRMMILG